MKSLDPNAQGALYMMVGLTGFALNDTIMKLVLVDLPLFQAIFLRGLAASLLLGAVGLRMGAFKRSALAFHPALLIRVLGEICGTICFFTALSHIPLADANAITQVTPLAVTLGAALFFGEKVGWRRALAIAIGFGGVMMIVRPGASAFSVYSYFALATVIFIAARDLASHKLPKNMSSIGVAFITSIATTIFAGSMSLTQDWVAVEARHIGLMSATACLLCVGYVFTVMTMRVGDVSFSAPFRYVSLPISILAGIVVFGEFPDVWMLIGSAIVVATGIYTFYRERKLAERGRATLASAQSAPPP